jgi:hypothetical protein
MRGLQGDVSAAVSAAPVAEIRSVRIDSAGPHRGASTGGERGRRGPTPTDVRPAGCIHPEEVTGSRSYPSHLLMGPGMPCVAPGPHTSSGTIFQVTAVSVNRATALLHLWKWGETPTQ